MSSLLPNPYPNAGIEDTVIVVQFAGPSLSIDGLNMQGIRDQLIILAEEPCDSPVLLDFGNVEYISAMALGVLVDMQKKMRVTDRRLILCNMNSQVHELFVITRLDKFLDLRLAKACEQPPEGRQADSIVGRPRVPRKPVPIANVLDAPEYLSSRRFVRRMERGIELSLQGGELC